MSGRPDAAAGYSGTPLARKLGYRGPVHAHAMPESVRDSLAGAPVAWQAELAGAGAAHLFVTTRAELAPLLAAARARLPEDGMLWISWPKKTAKRAGDLDENAIRDLALPLGWVDVKVCAVDAVWSGLKLTVRRELRGRRPAVQGAP